MRHCMLHWVGMMLKTELYPNRIGGITQGWSGENDLKHDAAYAHALVLAIGEIGVTDDGGYAQYCPASDTQSFLRERAEELMREWGYVEVEDE